MRQRRFVIDAESLPDLPGMMLVTLEALRALGGSATIDEATRDGAIAIDLIDGDRLCDLLKENNLGVKIEIETVERVHIQSEWFQRI